jgi:hypothetical protein
MGAHADRGVRVEVEPRRQVVVVVAGDGEQPRRQPRAEPARSPSTCTRSPRSSGGLIDTARREHQRRVLGDLVVAYLTAR